MSLSCPDELPSCALAPKPKLDSPSRFPTPPATAPGRLFSSARGHSSRFRAALALGLACFSLGCSSDDDAGATAPVEPPSLSISSLRPVGAPAWAPGASCVEVGRDAAGTLAVSVRLTNAELRAPGACGRRSACGHLIFRLTSADSAFSLTGRSSSTGHVFELGAADPQAAAPLGVDYRISAELVDDDGVPLTVDTEAVRDEVTVTLSAPGACGGTPVSDAGADSGTDAGADSGAMDAGSDAAADASSDAAADASSDAAADAASEAATDAASEAAADAGDGG